MHNSYTYSHIIHINILLFIITTYYNNNKFKIHQIWGISVGKLVFGSPNIILKIT